MEETALVLGGDVRCADAPDVCGTVKAVVVDASTGKATHLVVEPEHRRGLARLVPLSGIAEAQQAVTRLRYTEREFRDLPAAEETLAEFVPGSGEVQLLPAGEGWRPAGEEPPADGASFQSVREMAEADLVPALLGPAEDAQEEHPGDHVHASDGEIGRLRALGVDLRTGQVTHVVIKEHPWGRREVKIPASDVSGWHGGIHLSLTRQQVGRLHPGAGHPGG